MHATDTSRTTLIGDAMRAWATSHGSVDPAVVDLAVKVAQASYANGATVVEACCWSRDVVRTLNRRQLRLVG
ncbi:MAG TPA: hypothetical protein VL961_02060 [Acidimicrobiales bacterium]|nr:hypothetical protein [Acidimicrobiales bacterium]